MLSSDVAGAISACVFDARFVVKEAPFPTDDGEDGTKEVTAESEATELASEESEKFSTEPEVLAE